MSDSAQANQLNWPRWQRLLLVALLSMIVAVRLYALADDATYHAGLRGELTTLGGTFTSDSGARAFFQTVATVDPGGPMDKAGIKAGDGIRHNGGPLQFFRQPLGKRVNFLLDRGGVQTTGHLTVELAPQSAGERRDNFWLMLNKLAAMVTALIGCFILWRGWGNKTAMLLGAAMIPLHVASLTVPLAFAGPIVFAVFLQLTVAGFMLINLLPIFAMRVYEESVGALPRWQWRAVQSLILFHLLNAAAVLWSAATGILLPAWYNGTATGRALTQGVILLSVFVLIVAWHRSEGKSRNRNAVILFAFLAYLIGALAGFALVGDSILVASTAAGPLATFNAVFAGLVAPILLAYAVLRHKLFDLGFAVNRTLVFGAIGLLLLVSFALIEWAIKQAIPKVWYGGSVYISAGIAVSLYLLFNRIHHKVEHAIERLFFHKWQLNEVALKRFVTAAAHVEKPEALAENFVAELVRFTGGATAALYARTAEGHYASVAGKPIDADDPALAAMRGEQGAVIPAELGSTLDATLALPMMHQAALAGFVLLGPKPTGEDYRPDEVEVLGWATQQVGLDMQAIRVRELELTNTKLVARNELLAEIVTSAALKA